MQFWSRVQMISSNHDSTPLSTHEAQWPQPSTSVGPPDSENLKQILQISHLEPLRLRASKLQQELLNALLNPHKGKITRLRLRLGPRLGYSLDGPTTTVQHLTHQFPLVPNEMSKLYSNSGPPFSASTSQISLTLTRRSCVGYCLCSARSQICHSPRTRRRCSK
jgi:hypothetical protein